MKSWRRVVRTKAEVLDPGVVKVLVELDFFMERFERAIDRLERQVASAEGGNKK